MRVGKGLKGMGRVSIEIKGKRYEESWRGEGEYDGFVGGLGKIYKGRLGRKLGMLVKYGVSIGGGGGRDGFVERVMSWNYEDKELGRRGFDGEEREGGMKGRIKMLKMIEDLN